MACRRSQSAYARTSDLPFRGLFRALLACWLLLIVGCDQAPTPEPEVVRPVKMLTIEGPGTAAQREYPATVKATQQADMGFEVPGRIVEFLVNEGQIVEEGEVLARLDDRDYQADLEKARANQRKALADLNRSLSIYRQDKGAISKGAIESDRRAKEVADAAVQQSEKAVEDTVLRAPFEGYVARKLVEDFANVQAKEPVLILQDISQLEVEVSVPERDIAQGVPRQSPEEITERVKPVVSITSIPNRTFPARVKEFATTADPSTRTFQIRLVFERPDDVSILPGMTARVIANVVKQGGISIPLIAAQSDTEHQAFVWKVDPESMTVSRQPVALGAVHGAQVDIESGLEQGDVIATSGLRYLEEGTQVRRYGD
ncbi:MAG: efflux RND transporter periplasmic adaptor subunit [Gammaproteobacteria bacterium]|jgi:RND family efflux transporter MFP subunit